MGIYIPNMEMPEYCYECPCHNGESGYCQLYKDGYLSSIERPAKCPLVHLPEGHGDLIEKKSAKEKFCQFCFWKHQNKDACERCVGCPIDFIHTIVPAEGGTDK